jgi:hypothetical protein
MNKDKYKAKKSLDLKLCVFVCIFLARKLMKQKTHNRSNKQVIKQTNKQLIKQTNKQTTDQTNKQTTDQTNKQTNN